MATVAELKEAVHGGGLQPGTASSAYQDFMACMNWDLKRSLVWGHFYLCYGGQKLVDNKAPIRLYGIKDEDQPDKRRDGMFLAY